MVRRIFEEYVDSRVPPTSGIARLLNAERVTNVNRVPAETLPWCASCLSGRQVLGQFGHGDEWVKGEHPPIVDLAVWEEAQRLAEHGRKYAPHGRWDGCPGGHMLSRDASCAASAARRCLPRTDRRREWYACRTRTETWGAHAWGATPPLPRAAVETAALSLFEERALDDQATRDHLAAQLDSRRRDSLDQAKRADREVADLHEQAERVERDYRRGALSAESHERPPGSRSPTRPPRRSQRPLGCARTLSRTSDTLGDLDAASRRRSGAWLSCGRRSAAASAGRRAMSEPYAPPWPPCSSASTCCRSRTAGRRSRSSCCPVSGPRSGRESR